MTSHNQTSVLHDGGYAVYPDYFADDRSSWCHVNPTFDRRVDAYNQDLYGPDAEHYDATPPRRRGNVLVREMSRESEEAEDTNNYRVAPPEEGRMRLRNPFASSGGGRERERTRNQKEKNEPDHGTDKVKTRLLSMWNNVKHGWTVKVKTNFSKETAIHLLGICYHQRPEHFSDGREPDLDAIFRAFRDDFHSRVWLTYRREFPTLAGSSLTTDCGWGCMLRSGQMMLAQALIHHFLGREWRWNVEHSLDTESVHRRIIRWFGDIQKESSPFSLHQLVAIGESSGKKAGDWYGPASVAHILKQALEKGALKHPMLNELRIYVAQDCTVYKGDVMELCRTGGTHEWKGVVILVPVRLGGEGFNSMYINCIKSFLFNKNTLGVIGGRPRHSLYFVGWQDDKLIHLDPHYCQEMVDVDQDDYCLQSFHCPSPRKMSFSRMDPSCTIGFYCQSENDFDDVTQLSKEVVLKHSDNGDYPIFVVSEGKSSEHSIPNHLQMTPHRSATQQQYWDMRSMNIPVSEADAEEFVVL